jgi:hypothetical protein
MLMLMHEPRTSHWRNVAQPPITIHSPPENVNTKIYTLEQTISRQKRPGNRRLYIFNRKALTISDPRGVFFCSGGVIIDRREKKEREKNTIVFFSQKMVDLGILSTKPAIGLFPTCFDGS